MLDPQSLNRPLAPGSSREFWNGHYLATLLQPGPLSVVPPLPTLLLGMWESDHQKVLVLKGTLVLQFQVRKGGWRGRQDRGLTVYQWLVNQSLRLLPPGVGPFPPAAEPAAKTDCFVLLAQIQAVPRGTLRVCLAKDLSS